MKTSFNLLTPEQQDLRLMVREFADKEIIPTAKVLDITGGFPTGGLPTRAWLVLLYLALAATALALLFLNIGQKYSDPSSAAVLLAIVIVILIAILFAVENFFGKDVEG